MKTSEVPKKQMISPREAAEMLGVHRLTVFKWINEGRIPASRLTRRIIRIRVSDIEAMLQENAL